MKKITLMLSCFLISSLTFGQFTTTILDFNNVEATVTDGGALFQKLATNQAGYEIPKGSGHTSLYHASFWFAGMDTAGVLRMSATGYFANEDLFPGPIADPIQYGTGPYTALYNPASWTVTKAEVDNHIANWWQGGYVAPASILDWPGNGDVSLGVADQLAPFVDVNSNNIYEPQLGEYPYIRGDKATYMITNDMAGLHTHSNGEQMGIEVHFMIYQYATADYLNDMTFVNARVYNRGIHSYADFKCSIFMDGDVGNYADDYFGSDSTRNFIYTYNADNDDEDNAGLLGYGVDPPAMGIVTLNDPIAGAGYFTQTAAYPYNDPITVSDHWNFMNGSWADGSDWLVGGAGYVGSPGVTTAPTNFLLHGDPNNGAEWSEVSNANLAGDRRGFMNVATVNLPSQSDHCYEFAVVYSREAGNNNIQNVNSLQANVDLTQAFYDSHTEFSCDAVVLGINKEDLNEFAIYPNPSEGIFNIVLETSSDFAVSVRDMSGRVIQSSSHVDAANTVVDLNNSTGIYFITITTNGISSTKKVVVK